MPGLWHPFRNVAFNTDQAIGEQWVFGLVCAVLFGVVMFWLARRSGKRAARRVAAADRGQ